MKTSPASSSSDNARIASSTVCGGKVGFIGVIGMASDDPAGQN